ncbi:alpha/beta hydrolase [Streptococcus plurextorum]|uniref:alpha/beta hydrolase n=1 Tax=Streptococcus plurextorum TaxID=456876 RepID=UPI000408DA5C|nr:alpha/beta hydrolase [Streptococcus plurextorum]
MLIKKFNLDNKRDNVDLTSYILEDSPELLNGKKRPAIIICPGGAYINCSDREGEIVALRFAAMGYHVFVLRYHVLLDDKEDYNSIFSDSINFKDDTIFPTPMLDIANAFSIIHEHADDWLVDTDKLILCGFSAGGNNVTNYGVYWNKPIITNSFDIERTRPAAIIVGYPLTDYCVHQEFVKSQGKSGTRFFEISNRTFLGNENPTEEQLLSVSSAKLIDDSTPPMFIWTTTSDQLVNVNQSTILATALANKGIPFELHVFEDGPHGLSLATQATAPSIVEVDDTVRIWIDLAEKWLSKRFMLPLEKQSPWN